MFQGFFIRTYHHQFTLYIFKYFDPGYGLQIFHDPAQDKLHLPDRKLGGLILSK